HGGLTRSFLELLIYSFGWWFEVEVVVGILKTQNNRNPIPRIRRSDCGRPRCRREVDEAHGRSRDDGIRHCADAAASAPPLAQLCECLAARHIHHRPLWVTSPAALAVVPGQGSEIPEQRKQSSHQQS